jgi:hypothetical protein
VRNAGRLGDLEVDATSVYWTDGGDACVKKMGKSGGPVTVLATSPNVP